MLGPTVKLSDPGKEPKLVKRHKNALRVDPAYQRSMDSVRSRRLIEAIAHKFWWPKFGILIITEAGFIIDGQHRHGGAMLRDDVSFLPCLVHDVDLKEAASIFVGMNRDRVNITPQAVFKAELAAGHPEATRMKEICDDAGVEMIVNPKALRDLGPNQTQAISTIRSQIRHRPDVCARALKCCVAARVILSSTAIQSAFRHTVTFDDDELTMRMLRNFVRHGHAQPVSAALVPTGHLDKITAPVVPDRPEETSRGVVVRRFEAGNLDQIIERTLKDDGYRASIVNKGHPPKKMAMINSDFVPMDRAIARVNAIRARKGLPPI